MFPDRFRPQDQDWIPKETNTARVGFQDHHQDPGSVFALILGRLRALVILTKAITDRDQLLGLDPDPLVEIDTSRAIHTNAEFRVIVELVISTADLPQQAALQAEGDIRVLPEL